MNVARLLDVLNLLNDDYKHHGLAQSFWDFLTLNHRSGHLSDAKRKLLTVLHHHRLRELLGSCPSEHATPSQRAIMVELEVDINTGWLLRERIDDVLNEASDLESIDSISEDFLETLRRTNTLRESLEYFGQEPVALGADESEIGVILPSYVVERTLNGVESELHDMRLAFQAISELVQRDHADIRIRTATTSDLQLFLECAAPIAAATALAIERIVALYKNMLEVKKLQSELSRHEVPESIVVSLKAHIESLVETKVRAVADELVQMHSDKHSADRLNELKTATFKAVKYISGRMASGAVFEAVVGQHDEIEIRSQDQRSELTQKLIHRKTTESPLSILNKAGRAMLGFDEVIPEIQLLHDSKRTDHKAQLPHDPPTKENKRRAKRASKSSKIRNRKKRG